MPRSETCREFRSCGAQFHTLGLGALDDASPFGRRWRQLRGACSNGSSFRMLRSEALFGSAEFKLSVDPRTDVAPLGECRRADHETNEGQGTHTHAYALPPAKIPLES